MKDAAALIAFYRDRETTFRRAADAEAATSNQLSRIRLALVFVIIAAVATAVSSPAWRSLALITLLIAIVVFVAIAVVHAGVERRRADHAAFADLNREAQARIARAWNQLPDPKPVMVADDHPYAGDLDLVGHASLLQLIGPPNTPGGRAELASWLLGVAQAEPDVIAARQASVRELTPRLDERQQLQAAGLDARKLDAKALEPLLRWAESESWLLQRPWITFAARALAMASIMFLTLAYVGVTPAMWGALTTMSLGWVLMGYVSQPMNTAFGAASGDYTLSAFERLLTLVTSSSFDSPLLAEARRALHYQLADGTAIPAPRVVAKLRQCAAMADFRLTPFLYVAIQTIVVWDVHAWWLLERWRLRYGRHLRTWLEAIGRVETLAAIASLAHDQPSWTYPSIARPREAGHDRIVAEGLGHPLLRDDVRVTNDVTIGPSGSFLLITGSNMSGKSTLLRALGVNAVLAHIGAPVCARTLALPPVMLYTSMRVSDSLERGLSLFMASLLRLKQVVDAARRANPHERPLCYLLDEVLQGTNSAERQIAVRTIVGHLVHRGALGVVTTHDLELAAAPDFTAHADSRHFSEHVTVVDGELKMTFDYTLRPGPATSGNALQLVRMLGLEAD